MPILSECITKPAKAGFVVFVPSSRRRGLEVRRTHAIIVSIDRPHDDVYGYLVKPANYGQWAAVEAGTFRPLPNGDWQATTPFGFRHFRFTPPNAFGILDHAIFVPGGELFHNPMRVMPNDEGTELSFTFFQREGMDDVEFDSAVEWILTDFLALKSLLEAKNGRLTD